MSRKLKIIFTASILLNILLIGVGAGWYHKKSHYWPGGYERPKISDESREAIRSNFKQARSEMKPIFEEMRAAKTQMENVLSAPEFDEAAYDAAAKKLLDTRDKLSRTMAGSAKNFLEDLPPEDRKAMAKHMAEKMGGGGHRKKHRKPEDRREQEKAE